MVLKSYISSGRRLNQEVINLLFVITMLLSILFCSIFILITIFCVFNALLERFADIGLIDILDYASSSVLDGLKSFFLK